MKRFISTLTAFALVLTSLSFTGVKAEAKGMTEPKFGKVTAVVKYNILPDGTWLNSTCGADIDPTGTEQYSAKMPGGMKDLYLMEEVKYATRFSDEVVKFRGTLVKGKLSVIETTPAGIKLPAVAVETERAEQLKGAKYTSEVKVAVLDANWILVVASTTKGTDARCHQLKTGRLLNPSKF